jgi:hypothetical protein
MGIMSEIDNAGSVNPRAEKLYKQEYQHGANLFEKALLQANKSSYPPQQKEFAGVMNIAMEVLNQSARELKSQTLMAQSQKIAEKYKEYQKNPTKENFEALRSDLDKAKHSFD